MKSSIIIPIHVKPEFNNIIFENIKPCLDSIVQFTDLNKSEVILVLNGYTEECLEEVWIYQAVYGFKMICFKDGLGFGGAINQGLKLADSEFIIILNDDCVLLPQDKDNWINRLIKSFEDKTVGITGVHKLVCPYTNIQFIVGYCMALRRRMLNSIGVFDEIFNPGFAEDIDLCGRAQKASWKCIEVGKNSGADNELIKGDFPIYHAGEATFNHIPNTDQRRERAVKILIERKSKCCYS